MTEDEARQVLLLQTHETGAPTPLWTADDRTWATRQAIAAIGNEATPERFVATRAALAMPRLLPRDRSAQRWLGRRWHPGWALAAAVLGFAAGLAADQLGPPQRVNLLAPALWAVVGWNLVVYVVLLLPLPRLHLRRRLAGWGAPGGIGPGALWAHHAAPLNTARVALLLHAAAATLALGLITGLYLRGLVLDYRAGWQSTFLEPATVQAVLGTALAPARLLTGIAVPDVAPLRLAPGADASATAAPWIHLFAATLALFVVLPRVLLALRAGWVQARGARQFPLPLDGPYFQQLLHGWRRSHAQAQVQLLPHGAAPGPAAVLGLRAVLAAAWGEGVQIAVAAATAHGDEQTPPAAAAGTTLRLVLVDLAATPEAEAQGRFVAALQPGGIPLLLLADEAGFRRRFAGMPARLAERRRAWQTLADAQDVKLVCVDLEQPDLDAAAAAMLAP